MKREAEYGDVTGKTERMKLKGEKRCWYKKTKEREKDAKRKKKKHKTRGGASAIKGSAEERKKGFT